MNTTMRTTKDRIRHAILFEIVLLGTCIPLLSIILENSAESIGAVSIGISVISTLWNYAYNYLFDHALLYLKKPLYPRNSATRITHALLFECTLLVVTIPAVMLFLNFSFIEALIFDLGFIIAIPFYAIAFNYAYDRIFPVGETSTYESAI